MSPAIEPVGGRVGGDAYESWGRTAPRPRRATREMTFEGHVLPYGNGRSYGDSCLNDGTCGDQGTLIDMRGRNRLIAFCPRTGLVRAQAGMMLGDLVRHTLPHGWFPAVVPGTRFVTLGGMLANDVHGKNHHRRGTFGARVTRFHLLRSDGEHELAPGDPLFAATIGGMGLTGIVTWLELRLMRVAGGAVAQRALPFGGIDEYLDLIGEAEARHEYAVAWVDSLAAGDALGRGVLLTGDHAAGEAGLRRRPRLAVPFTPPVPLVSSPGIRAFNALYRRSQRDRNVGAAAFFWPLDGIAHWNRLYGPRGLHQHQSVVPQEAAAETLPLLLRTAQEAGQASFLTVLKRFGAAVSPGPSPSPAPDTR